MALSINQTPAHVSLAQSPIVFSVYEDSAIVVNSGFQYVAGLYYWTGSLSDSGSTPDYTLVKYPNNSLYGIFDASRIINATLTNLAIANPSNVEYLAIDFWTQWLSGSVYVTGSHIKSDVYKALDGYGIFQEQIGVEVYNTSQHWPLMTDGPVTQSFLDSNYGTAGVYVGDAGSNIPNRLVYSGSFGNGQIVLSGSLSSSQQVQQYPIGPLQAGFPLSTASTYYTIQAHFNNTPLGLPIKYELACQQKYPNVRLQWKNRFGQFDWFNFYMINRQSFQTETRTYQPQLGTWEAPTLSYNRYDSSTLNYIADSKQAVSVNSFWIPETYNEILKQLLVSDEIYWVYDEANNYVRPVTITTQNIVFKTGVNDHLIQYQFDFNYGQAYKLII